MNMVLEDKPFCRRLLKVTELQEHLPGFLWVRIEGQYQRWILHYSDILDGFGNPCDVYLSYAVRAQDDTKRFRIT